jgi:hypothetical protein
MKERYYISYGSNLNKTQMRRRCPNAVPVCGFVMPDTRLVFKGVADVESAPGYTCQVGLWKITKACERALDAYEGCRWQNGKQVGMYRKEYIRLSVGGQIVHALIYVMNDDFYALPSSWYFESIVQGYRDFGLPVEDLYAALDDLINNELAGEVDLSEMAD